MHLRKCIFVKKAVLCHLKTITNRYFQNEGLIQPTQTEGGYEEFEPAYEPMNHQK